jgi:Gas vesicle protein
VTVDRPAVYPRSTGLVDVLDRVLDKGLVIAGDIRVSLAEVELLTIRIRLIVCSLDKASEIGLDWWRYDRHLSPASPRARVESGALSDDIRLPGRAAASAAGRDGERRPARPRRRRGP